MITLTHYIKHRLGSTTSEQAVNFLAKPFSARSLAEFWQYWNPVWTYFLLFYCYRLLRQHLSRSPSVILTFFFCGLVHDLPFGILSYLRLGRPPLFTLTVFLTLNGVLVVLSEKTRLTLTRIPAGRRWLTHFTILMTSYLAALHLTTWTGMR